MLDGNEFRSVLTVQASFDGMLSLEHQRDCETLGRRKVSQWTRKLSAIAYVWCIHWNSFSTVDSAGLYASLQDNRCGIYSTTGSLTFVIMHLQTVVSVAQHSRQASGCSLACKKSACGSMLTTLIPTGEQRNTPKQRSWQVHLKSQAVRHSLIGHNVMSSLSPWQLSLIHFACIGEVVWGQLAAFVSGMKSSS
ncbi:hypothetical protein BGW80DRAFT_1330754 [Lactifluus volemus]|nr:hypothetical protein BGW80DRAFT_1330754 [Lactifluus volemus]